MKIEIKHPQQIAVLLIIFGIRCLGDVLFYFFKTLDSEVVLAWKFFSAIIFIAFLANYCFSMIKERKELSVTAIGTYFFNNTYVTLVLVAVIAIINSTMPTTVSAYLLENNVLRLMLNDIESFALITISIYFAYTVYLSAMLVPFRRTKKLLAFLGILLLLAFFSDALLTTVTNVITHKRLLIAFFAMLPGLIILVLFGNTSWIAVLSRGKKWLLILFSLLIFNSCFYYFYLSVSDLKRFYSALSYFGPGMNVIAAFLFFCVAIMYFRFFLSSIAALPTSGIVKQRYSEFESLTDLNKIIASTSDTEKLPETICNLALKNTFAKFAWIEIHFQGSDVERVYPETPSLIKELAEYSNAKGLREYLDELKEPLLLTSVPDFVGRKPEFSFLNFTMSLIIIPIITRAGKIGNLLVASDNEYSLNTDSLKLLTAYGDNISIAIDNSRLKELALAREMQRKLLPETTPQIPGYSIAAYSNPAETVGGDYYDFVTLKDGSICMLIGDVSGKGISAAFIMAQLKGIVISAANVSTSATDILCRINSVMFGKMERKMYITLSAITFNKNDGKVHYARGGHTPAITRIGNGIGISQPKGIGIGLASSAIFDKNIEEISFDMQENDILLFFTDGVSERRNINGEEFGYENLKQIISSGVYKNADEIIENINADMKKYAGTISQFDDVTILTLLKTSNNKF